MRRQSLLVLASCLIALLAVMFAAAATYAGPLSLYGCVSVPVGAFGDDTGEDAGLANTGVGFGLEYKMPLGVPSLAWVFDAAVVANPIDLSPIFALTDSRVENTSWWTFPVLTGIKFTAPASPLVTMYGKGLVGVGFTRSPEITATGLIDYEGTVYTAKLTQKSASGTSFGFKVGGGLLIGGRLDVGVNYLNLGKPEFKPDRVLTFDGYSDTAEREFKQSISMLIVSAGIRF